MVPVICVKGLSDMTELYPVSLNLTGKTCVVVGGGSVALRKVKTLLEYGAHVTVISPQLDADLEAMQTQFTWIPQGYADDMLAGAFLVIAATDSRDVNHQVAVWCAEHQVLVNVVDSKEESSFTVNAAVRQGDLTLTVSTNGVSPAISRKIRKQLQQQFGPEYAMMLEIVREIRNQAMETIPDEARRREFLQSLADMELQEQLRQEPKEQVEKRVKQCLSSYWD